MRIAFVASDVRLSGGAIVFLRHAEILALRFGHEVTVVTRSGEGQDWVRRDFPTVVVRNIESPEVQSARFDVAVATYWETLFALERVRSERYVWFAQSVEDRFYPADDPMGSIATAAITVPVPVVTEARWIHDLLVDADPHRSVQLAPNGIDKSIFSPSVDRSRSADSELDVLIEGDVGNRLKDVETAVAGVLAANGPIRVRHITTKGPCTDDPRYEVIEGPLSHRQMADAYRSHDVLVKTSRVEGMAGPPLEAFHCGSTVVTTPVTGHEEYIVDGENSIVVGWDDPQAIGWALDLLNSERGLLERLKGAALATAATWPSLEESTLQFDRALTASIATGSAEFDRANLAALRAIRSFRAPQLKLHLQLIATDRFAAELAARISSGE